MVVVSSGSGSSLVLSTDSLGFSIFAKAGAWSYIVRGRLANEIDRACLIDALDSLLRVLLVTDTLGNAGLLVSSGALKGGPVWGAVRILACKLQVVNLSSFLLYKLLNGLRYHLLVVCQCVYEINLVVGCTVLRPGDADTTSPAAAILNFWKAIDFWPSWPWLSRMGRFSSCWFKVIRYTIKVKGCRGWTIFKGSACVDLNSHYNPNSQFTNRDYLVK